MSIEIKVPPMGESISEATIGAFLKANGSEVKTDDELLELETDKVNQVLYAAQSGVVNWKVKLGETVKIGQVIGSIVEGKENPLQKEASNLKREEPIMEMSKPEKPKLQEEMPVPNLTSPPKEAAPSSFEPDISNQSESGSRFTKKQFIEELKENPEDHDKTAKNLSPSSQPVKPVYSGSSLSNKSETRKKMTKIRKVIASRLVEVLRQTAMLTTFNEVDMTRIIELRESYKEGFLKKHNVRLGFMPFFVKAAISAMEAFPEINAYIDGDDLVYRNTFDIGIAVGTEKGLFVPVVRNCEKLSFADIERSIESFALKAKEGGLVPDDLQGGGFTITNGGVYGSLLSTPILNPPQSAILGMHKIAKRAVVVNDQIVIRQMMYLALSYDHRVIDGKEAVSFLVHIKNALEDPSRLLIGI